ncbi:phosphonate ABC transporter substrate-binding protein [Salinarimonas ramus]|uniref:Phosphonate ABC transporter substrate-binding protein n=2 Tax=Salinarimonas ramus TaxID=690164 RepID=A0A917Q3S1_9HYPH|nr:phosphonate ABC transporter substrate-binding protein [Salinarimonas ramus]
MKLMTVTSVLAIAAAGVLAAGSANAQTRDTIQIAGSSTVLPFASIVAEEFGNAFPQFNTPVVGSGGSSGGLRQFCAGVGENTIDIANSSRPIRDGEVEACAAAGVEQIIPVRFGFDGIVFATNQSQDGTFDLQPEHVYQALAAQVPVDGALVDNPYTSWNQIDESLPEQDIVVAIPASNHGTREVFEERVVLPGCETFDVITSMEEDAAEEACLGFRQDGRVIEIAGDYTETLARLEAQPQAMGVFGLSFYDQNRDRLKVATVNGVEPSLETIGSGDYPVSRPLFFYLKGEHMDVIPGIEEYATYFLSDEMAGPEGVLVEAGLIPLSDEQREEAIRIVEEREAL